MCVCVCVFVLFDAKRKHTNLAHLELYCHLDRRHQYISLSLSLLPTPFVGGGAQKALAEWRKYRCSDDKEFDMNVAGPTGYGVRGKAVGCKPFFERLNGTYSLEVLLKHTEDIGEVVHGQENHLQEKHGGHLDKLAELLSVISHAQKHTE